MASCSKVERQRLLGLRQVSPTGRGMRRVRKDEYLRGFPRAARRRIAPSPRGGILPRAKQMEGFKGMIALGDRQSGKTLGITFWESEVAMRASEEAANRLRGESAEASGG